MIGYIKKILGLNPKEVNEKIEIKVGVFNGTLQIRTNKKVDVITFNKDQLRAFLAAVASQAALVK